MGSGILRFRRELGRGRELVVDHDGHARAELEDAGGHNLFAFLQAIDHVDKIAAGLAEPRDTVEEVIEPYLIQLGLVARTARGRCLNDAGWVHLDIAPPAGSQTGLFDQGK